MAQEIRTIRIDFEGKTLTKTVAEKYEGKVSSAIVMLSGFYQKFSDGENVRTASAYLKVVGIDENLVDVKAALDIQPTNTKSREGWIEGVLIAEVTED